MNVRSFLLCLFAFFVALAPAAFAGKTELTTYYPAPYGEYQDLEVKSQIVGGFGGMSGGGVTDWNDATNARSGNGYTLLRGDATNGPSGIAAYYHPFNFEYMSKDGTGNMTQLAIPYYSAYNNAGDVLWLRTRFGGTWSSWHQILTENASGRVGIGTTIPVGKLDVRGSLASIAWTAAPFGTGWSNYAGGYQAVQYKKFGDFVYLRGLASSGGNAWASYPTIMTLPVGCRPTGGTVLLETMANANQAVRVDIDISGNVKWSSGGAGSNWLSLDGISFSVD